MAIVGENGVGKTTLSNLLLKFFKTTTGEIFIDGININSIDTNMLRESIGIVPQEVYLFNGTILENILYGNISSTKENAILAAKQANAHEFITRLEHGYDTYISENGNKLSGGQKQKIIIARLFLRNPALFILDEATSSLDNESEKQIQSSLEKFTNGKTVITISHRLTSIRNADRIIVLTPKGIEEEGTHMQLMDKRGVYYHLYSELM